MSLQSLRLLITATALLTCVVGAPSSLFAATIINDGGVTLINGPSDAIEIANGPASAATAVVVEVGADIAAIDDGADPNDGRSIGVTENSVLIASGGVVQGDITIADQGIGLFLGTAEVGGDISVEGNGEVQISSNATVGGEVFIGGTGSASFLGGEVSVFGVGDNATATINGGSIDDDMDAVGNGVLTVLDVFVNDDVDAEDNAVMHLVGGVYDEDVEATGNSTINISGGEFGRIFSDGAFLVSSGGTVNVTGGVFGAAGAPSDGGMSAVAGGVINFKGAEIAGASDGTASQVNIDTSINGQVNLEEVQFGDLSITAVTGATATLSDITAGVVSISLQAGNALIDVTAADELDLLADVSSLAIISGGDFGSSLIRSLGGSTIEIRGSDFLVNGIPFGPGEVPFISGDIQATFKDGTVFSTLFSRQFTAGGAKILLVSVPEPASLAMSMLLATAGVALTTRRRRVQGT